MGDDLGDDWGYGGINSDAEGEDDFDTAQAAPKARPASLKKKQKKRVGDNEDENKDIKHRQGRRRKSRGEDEPAGPVAGTKRWRPQLSPEGFEDSSVGGSDGLDEGEDGVGGLDEGFTLETAEEEEEAEAKRRRAEKKREKFKALKAKLKEKKQRRLEAESGGTPEGFAAGAETSEGSARGKQEVAKIGVVAPPGATELWAAFCKVRENLVTPLETDRPWISDETVARVEGFGAHSLSKLVGFIKASLPDWKKRIQNRNAKSPRGSPYVVIVCSGARRCVQVIKNLTAFRCQVLKLFAKHLKLEEQKVMLKKGCFPLAVGTPGRVRALAACGSLRLDECALLILDVEKNVKARSVLDMDGVARETMALLADHAKPYLTSSSRNGVSKSGGGDKGGRKVPGAPLRIALY